MCLEGSEGADELCAGLFEGIGGGDGAVGLELDEEVGVERVGDFVAREEDLWGLEELAVDDVLLVRRGR